MSKKRNLTVVSIQNKASNPADFSEMTQCFDMWAKKQELFCLSTNSISLLPQEIQRESHGNN